MDEETINTSLNQEITDPEGGNLGKPSDPNGGQKHSDYRRASTGFYQYGGNSRTNSMGKPTFLSNGHIRASTGSFHDVVNSGRNSIGKPRSPNSRESATTPNYLRSSTGSCHDFCKYGRKHAVEAKERRTIPKRVIKPPSDRQSPTESGVSAERKPTKVVKPKPSTVSKTLMSDSHIILKQEVSSPSQKVEISSRQASSNEKKIAQNEKKKNLSVKRTAVKPRTMTVKPLSSSDTSGGMNGGSNAEIFMKKVLPSPMASGSSKPSINRVVSLNVRKYRSLKLVSPLKDQNTIRKADPKRANNKKVPEKTLHVVKVETENKVLESTQNGSTLHSPPSPLLSSPKFSSLPKPPPLSFQEEEALDEFEYTDSEADESDDSISDSSETVNLHEVETSNGNRDRAPKKAGVGFYEDKDCTPTKLKFRRGRVVDLQSENSAPRRLRFRRGRLLGENQDSKADVRRRRFKKRGDDDDDTNATNADSEKVVLRHQDETGKKDAQGLFNNVIEETASKLVESRKSKVKALVGAFETVISLQETKPSTQTVT